MLVNRNGEAITSPLPANWCLQNNAHKMGWGDTCTAASNQTHYLRSKNSIRTTNVHFYVIIRNQILLIYLELVDFFSLFFLGISFKLYMSGGIHRLSPVLEYWLLFNWLRRVYRVMCFHSTRTGLPRTPSVLNAHLEFKFVQQKSAILTQLLQKTRVFENFLQKR